MLQFFALLSTLKRFHNYFGDPIKLFLNVFNFLLQQNRFFRVI